MMQTLRELSRRPTILVTVGVLAAAGLSLGARAVTTTLLGPEASPISVDAGTDGGVAAAATSTTSTTEVQAQVASTVPSTSTTRVAPSTTQTPPDGPAGDGLTVGEPMITPRQPFVFTDRLTVLPAVATDFPSFPTRAPAEEAAGSGTGLVDRPDVTNGEAAPLPRAFNVGVLVEADSHYAVIRVGIDAGPAGLADLVVDFGDGEVLEVSQARIDQVGDVGTIEIVHRYEPTLTPQPQEVTATATDAAGTVKVATASFETQAEFLLSYSPLTVTALDDCDLFGKGDYALYWNNDGRDRDSRFDLSEGESYVEEGFRVGSTIQYGEEPPVTVSVEELDHVFELFVNVFTFHIVSDLLSEGPVDLFAEVMEVGTHTVPFSIDYAAQEDCHVRLESSATLALSERSAG